MGFDLFLKVAVFFLKDGGPYSSWNGEESEWSNEDAGRQSEVCAKDTIKNYSCLCWGEDYLCHWH